MRFSNVRLHFSDNPTQMTISAKSRSGREDVWAEYRKDEEGNDVEPRYFGSGARGLYLSLNFSDRMFYKAFLKNKNEPNTKNF